MTRRKPTRTEHDQSRVELAERLARAEGITFAAASRKIPNDPKALRELIARLNNRDATRARTTARKARESGETFTQVARRTR